MAKGRNNKKMYRRRRGLRLLYLLLSFVLIAVALVTSCAFFFRVDQIKISGNTRYSSEQILIVADIKKNTNLLLLPRKAIATSIAESYPYVNTVKLKSRLPTTLAIEIEESIPLASVCAEGALWILDAKGNILEQVEESIASEFIRVEGLSLLAPQVGARAQVTEEAARKLSALCALLASLQENGKQAEVSWIDMSKATDVEMDYMGRFTVRLPLGDGGSLAREGGEYSLKIEALGKIAALLSETDRGSIDLWEDKGFFSPR